MKRVPLFVSAGTIAGLTGILIFHTHPPSSSVGALSGTGSGRTASHSQGKSGSGSGSRHGAASQNAGGNTIRTATGATEQYGYGELAVRVTVRSGKIINVAVPLIQTAESYSQQLAAQAFPMLRNEVLSAQSAHINGVSGATYTSQAYATSLQAALDKLHQA
jgi:uncharacterized protein with FMN-binding domain